MDEAGIEPATSPTTSCDEIKQAASKLQTPPRRSTLRHRMQTERDTTTPYAPGWFLLDGNSGKVGYNGEGGMGMGMEGAVLAFLRG